MKRSSLSLIPCRLPSRSISGRLRRFRYEGTNDFFENDFVHKESTTSDDDRSFVVILLCLFSFSIRIIFHLQ